MIMIIVIIAFTIRMIADNDCRIARNTGEMTLSKDPIVISVRDDDPLKEHYLQMEIRLLLDENSDKYDEHIKRLYTKREMMIAEIDTTVKQYTYQMLTNEHVDLKKILQEELTSVYDEDGFIREIVFDEFNLIDP